MRRLLGPSLFGGIVAFLLLGGAVLGHPLSVSYSHWIIAARSVHGTIRLPVDDMDLLLQIDRDLDGRVTESEIQQSRAEIGTYLAQHVRVVADGDILLPALDSVSTWQDQAKFPYLEAQVTWRASRTIETAVLTVTAVMDLYPAHRVLAEVVEGVRRTQFVFQRGNSLAMTRGVQTWWQAATSFLVLGFEHILTGYDHVVFLFGLLLVAREFRQLVVIVTTFTVAHSATLSLATLGLVVPPVAAIEAAIALSIAYVGVENLLSQDHRGRWKVVFAFGLVHGFGFASILRDMELPRRSLAISLVTFNVGVEVGQLAIVALMFPVLRLARRTRYERPAIRYSSIAVVALGAYWFYDRAS